VNTANGSPRWRRYLLVALALLPILVAAVVVQGGLLTRDAVRTAPLAASLEVCYDPANGNIDLGCVITVVESRSDGNPVGDAEEVLALSKLDPRYAEGCHSIMHALGQQVMRTPRYLNEPESLLHLWDTCGYGLLHGVFEKIDLPNDVEASAEILKTACEIGGIGSDERLRGECLHALGHAVYDNFDSDENRSAACSAAFNGDAPGMSPRRIGCYSGLAMKERDALLQLILDGLAEVEPTPEGFAEAAAFCSVRSDAEWAQSCAPGFVQVATDYGASHVPAFLEWCSNLLGSSGVECYRQAGIYMGHFNKRFSGLEQVMVLCESGEGTFAGENTDVCRAAVATGLQNSGSSPADAVERVCEVLATVSRGPQACEIARSSIR
jgi:hypothetical protein